MKDNTGMGPCYTSWVDKMIQRVRNVIKSANKKVQSSGTACVDDGFPPLKKEKKDKKQILLRRYPLNNQGSVTDDPSSVDGHIKGMEVELKKTKPREGVLLPLMKSTFQSRRSWIIDEPEPVSVYLAKYAALSRPSVIEQELDLIIGKATKALFCHNWSSKYVPAIILYAKKSTKGAIKKLTEMIEIIETEEKEKVCLKIVYECFKSRNQSNGLNYLYEEFEENNHPVQELCKLAPPRNSPRIIKIPDTDGVASYHIICEQTELCHCYSFPEALFLCFATYYLFNLDYPKQVVNVLMFLQDYILNYPDSNPRPAKYIAVTTDINSNVYTQ
jgi:hypothetical protein